MGGGRWAFAGAGVRHVDAERGVRRARHRTEPEVTAPLPAVPYRVRREFGHERRGRAARVRGIRPSPHEPRRLGPRRRAIRGRDSGNHRGTHRACGA
ncbi:hypothetical protein BM536_025570 [Streptomyces phaeoluteigriseus]|uniref:Uncharacterized protein n=1 Tax=Streptomyces phaeoluteigriseus TaxID=114686 RepID=A0A1V6MMX9_9ACTN|nr:hypothetical protein BM536_025570 [Streptomyces phaeoluteigriseus]